MPTSYVGALLLLLLGRVGRWDSLGTGRVTMLTTGRISAAAHEEFASSWFNRIGSPFSSNVYSHRALMVIGDELGSGFAFGGLVGVTTAFAAGYELTTDCCACIEDIPFQFPSSFIAGRALYGTSPGPRGLLASRSTSLASSGKYSSGT